MAALWTSWSCKDKHNNQHPTTNSLVLRSKQDTIKKKVSQQIFDEVVTFGYSDFRDLQHNKSYDRFLAGQLILPTGRVICTDPLYQELALPQSWAVNKGEYPVYLYVGLNGNFAGRIAYAELALRDEPAVYWELSLIDDKLLADNFEKKINGMYPVEGGLSCFADVETFRIFEEEVKDYSKLHKDGNYYSDVLARHFKENADLPKSSRGEDWTDYKPAKAHGNLIMFGSGWGDGLYPRYVGYNKQGEVVALVTDFIQLKDPR